MRKNKKVSHEKNRESLLTLETLIPAIQEDVNEYLKQDTHWKALRNQTTFQEEQKKKEELRHALRWCTLGDSVSKEYLCSFIRRQCVDRYALSEERLDQLLPFQNAEYLSAADCFEIMLMKRSRKEGRRAFANWMDCYVTGRKDKEDWYEVTDDVVRNAYRKEIGGQLSFFEKLDFIVQKIYAGYKGFHCIDLLLEQQLDGISGGVSGIPHTEVDVKEKEKKSFPRSYNSIWVFFRGVSYHMVFLGFLSQEGLERVCKNIYRYHAQSNLSQLRGYQISERADGSRVVVMRPPFCESWAFFVRKFDTVASKKIRELYAEENAILLENICHFLVLGQQTITITGSQGAGKTTLLAALIDHIPEYFTLRVLETAFELNLRKTYPNRNIVSFRETQHISGQQALDLQKKTDGMVHILGEVATAPVASYMIQMGTTASLFTMFTHHAKTTAYLIQAMRNALLQTGSFSDERMAQEQVLSVLRFDIHLRNDHGHRYVEYIHEILPDPMKPGEYRLQNILRYVNGHYELEQWFSEEVCGQIIPLLSQKQLAEWEKTKAIREEKIKK